MTPHAASQRKPLVDSLIVTVRLNDISLLNQVVLALVVEQPRHGYGLVAALGSDEALAMAIAVRRPLVYRAIVDLERANLIVAGRKEVGERGSSRTVYRATPKGRRLSGHWLDAVVEHPRDARLELLAKFALRSRRGLSNRRLAAEQRRQFERVATALRRSPQPQTSAANLVRRWRYESVAAMIELLRDVESGDVTASATE